MEYPEFIARFYDTVYAKIRSGQDHAYYMEKIKATSGPVLEIGVGTGRFFFEALEQGADIYGVDISAEMVKVLKKKLPPDAHARLFIQDAVHLKIPVRFDLVIAPFRMFSHILKTEDQLRFFRCVADHLKPGGQFIMDVFVPDLALIQEGLKNFTDFEGETEDGINIKRTVSMSSNLIEQVSTIEMTFHWGEKEYEKMESWGFKMRYFFRYELEHLIARSPLKLNQIFGSFNEDHLQADSREFLVVCSKPN